MPPSSAEVWVSELPHLGGDEAEQRQSPGKTIRGEYRRRFGAPYFTPSGLRLSALRPQIQARFVGCPQLAEIPRRRHYHRGLGSRGRERARLMLGEDADPAVRAEDFDRASVGARLDDERRRAGLLGDVREAIFGAQDGLVSTLAVVSTVSGATNDRYPVLIAGIAAGLAGIFSMAAGEYLSSKSQREISLAQIGEEREKVAKRPEEVQIELAHILEEDGLPRDEASAVAGVMGRHREILLNTKVLRQYGVAVEEAGGSPIQGAAVMGAAFALGALAPILPYLLLPFGVAVYASVVATGGVLFAIGVVKTRWTHGQPIWSGIEILAIGTLAGIVGYFFGSVLPTLLGAPAVGG
jgi:VIT1/CCC1 family predicted Fe2+/Mn2+ transporter